MNQYQQGTSLHQQLAQAEQLIQQLSQQTQQASAQYQQLLNQEQQNASTLQQLAQREQQAAQTIQMALQGHQTAMQQLHQISSLCNQIAQSANQMNTMPMYNNNNMQSNYRTAYNNSSIQ